jgi:putative toxin-antitoxin system antitoxin component (TIGR02293 family)
MTSFAMRTATKTKSAKPGRKTAVRPLPVKKPKMLPGKKMPVASPGLDFGEFEDLRRQLDLSLEDLAARRSLSRATVDRRKATGRLTKDESDRVVRFARLLGHAAHLFGGLEEARQWLRAPQSGLGGAAPLDHAQTEADAQEVENLLGRIAQGVPP